VSEDSINWKDISTYGNPGYGGTIGDPQNQAKNVLKGRQGYVATNPSWPSTDAVTVNLGTVLAGKTIRVRFRIATDDAVGDVGWQIDDIAFQGITNMPFASLVPNQTACNTMPSSSTSTGGAMGAGGGAANTNVFVKGHGCACKVHEASSTDDGLATLLALSAFVVARARRANGPGWRSRLGNPSQGHRCRDEQKARSHEAVR
jgi:hypothetical protein